MIKINISLVIALRNAKGLTTERRFYGLDYCLLT
jgi:hypothetical protein